MSSRLTSNLRIKRAQYRRWVVSRRRAVPQPVLIRLRTVGIVAVVLGIIVQSLAGWEGPAAAGSAPRVDVVVHTESDATEVRIEAPAVRSTDLALAVVSRVAAADDIISAPPGWELLRRDDHPGSDLYQAVFRGPSGVDAVDLTWAFSQPGFASVSHLTVVGAGGAPAIDAVTSSGESAAVASPLAVAASTDSLVLDLVATPDVVSVPAGMATVHAVERDGLSIAFATMVADVGLVEPASYPSWTGAAQPGVVTRLVLAPDPETTPVSPATAEPTPDTEPTEPATVPETTEPEPITETTSGPADRDPDAPQPWDVTAEATSAILEQNEGQFDEAVDFVVRGEEATVFLAGGALVYETRQALAERDGDAEIEGHVVRMTLEGADPEAQPMASGLEASVTNYFIGADPSEWVTGVEAAEVVVYEEVLEGVDIRYLGTGAGLRYDLIVHPGADPDSLSIAFDGADGVSIDGEGRLLVDVSVGDDLVFSAPVTYQDTPGGRVAVDSAYVLNNPGSVGFEVGAYDADLPLVIDPTLDLATYLGGSGADLGDAVGVDSSGNVIVAGRSQSTDYPTTAGAYDTTKNPFEDIVVSKLSADGSALLWSTYVGGSSGDAPLDLVVDGSDRIVVVGYTSSSDFPTVSAYDATANGGVDGFVFRLSSTGSALDFSTYVGGAVSDYFTSVAMGPSGSIVIGGYTNSSGFPTTAGAYDTSHGGNDDGVVLRLSSAGTSLVYSTFLGGTTRDRILGIAVGSTGTVHAIGDSQGSLSLPAGGYDTTHNGNTDAFYAELSSDGSSLLYASYLGAGSDDYGYDVALGSDTDIFLVGATNSSGFPTTSGAYDTSFGGTTDGWVARLDRTQTGSAALAWSTFYGGTGADEARDVEVDESGRAYVGMTTGSTGLATADGWDTTLSGTSDALLGVFSADGSQLLTASYVGGSGSEEVWNLVLDAQNRPVMVGDTSSTDFPTLVGAYDRTLGGTWDMFVVRSTALPPPNVVTVNSTGDAADALPGNGVCSTGGTNSAGQPACTLRAAIQEANASAGIDTIEFDIPATETGYSGARGVFTITATSSLPNITAGVTIDGATQTTNRGDTNPGVLGFVGSVGTGPDGVVGTGDEPSIDGVPAPEVELVLAGHQGFVVDADAVTISGLAVYGGNRDLAIISGADTVIEDMVIGAFADSFTDPGLGVRSTGSAGVAVQGGSGTIVRNNLIGYQANRGIEVSGTLSDVTVSGNEIRGTSQETTTEGGGIEIINFWAPPGSAASGALVTGNLITDRVDDYGIEVATAAGDSGIVIRDNTLDDIGPILVYGIQNADGGEITNNVIIGSNGHAVQVSDVAGWAISQNSISGSAWIGIALYDGNDGLAAPMITAAASASGEATVDYTVTGPAGTYMVEFFDNTVAGPGGFGEGETYLGFDSIAHPGGTATHTHTVSVPAGAIVSATLTEDLGGGDLGSTSEFSNAFTVIQGVEPVVLDNVQKGTATLAGGSSSVTATIAAVDPTKAFLQFSVRGNNSRPGDITVTGELTNATTLTFAREETTGTVTIEWSVVEFVSGVSVQRGSTTLASTSTDLPISTVDLSRSFVLMNSRATGGTFGANDFPRAALTSPSNLRISISSSGGNVVKWQVVTYNESAVQRGTASFAAGEASVTSSMTAVDTSKAWLVYTNTTAEGSGTNIGQKLIRGVVTNGTTLTFDRSSTGQTLDVAWELVEFSDATEVQHASVAFANADTSRDVTIAAVDPARSIAVGGATLYGGRSAYTSDDNPGVGWFTTQLTNSTTLRVQRDAALATADLGWFVIHWPGTVAPLVVNSTGDTGDNAPGDGYCWTGSNNTAGQRACTLRAAIEEANANPYAGEIHFSMPSTETGHSGGVWTISPGSELPPLTDTVTIDGTSQPGWASTPVVELNGSSAGGLSDGLRVSGNGTTIRGLAINRFGADGIEVGATASNTLIAGNHIGVSAGGTVDRGNGGRGIDLSAGSGPTTVGGSDSADRNLISGNGGDGIIVWNSSGNTIIGNFIGIDVTGAVAISNGADGIALGGGSSDNVIGRPGAGNVLSGNGNDGVELGGAISGNVIQANTIGLGADGSVVVANGRHGVVLFNGANTSRIGGDSLLGEGNVIAGNTQEGIHINANLDALTAGNSIQGNLIGTDATGTLDRGNGSTGINIFNSARATIIGGTSVGLRNVISGNGANGLYLQGAGTVDTVIHGNHIGVGSDGITAVPNTGRGVVVSGSSGNQIGGTGPGEGNVVSGNTGDGVYLELPAAVGNLVQGNLIGLGVDGATPVGNGGDGVDVNWDVGPHTIGGTGFGAGNVISANTAAGIRAFGTSDLTVAGNLIGLDAGGGLDRGNGTHGVLARGTGLVVGGSSGGRNVISGNGSYGVYLDAATGAVISNNRIGTDAAGTAAVANSSHGIFNAGASGSQIIDNLISGNGADGIQVSSASTGVVIRGNVIGADLTGTAPIPNSWGGIRLFGTATVIGGTGGGHGNTIAFNQGDAVAVGNSSLDNSVLANSIVGNAGLGIDLSDNGVTANDAGDADAGANDLLNFPEMVSAVETAGSVDVTYTLDVPAGNYRIEFFTNTAADPSGYGEGETFVHSATVSHPGTGSQSFTTSFAGSSGDIVTATTTEDLGGGAYGSTSEFSQAVVVNASPTAVDDAATTDEDTGAIIDVLVNDTDPDGDALTVTAVTDGANGTVVDNGDGTVTYTPDPDWNGVDSFTYTISDGRGGTDTATVTITVTPINDAPVAVDDADTVVEDESVTVDVLVNDFDVDGDTLTVVSVTQGVNGSVVVNGDGTVSYTPDADWNGVDSFTYTVSDGVLTDSATVTVTVVAVNDAPVAVDDNTGTDEDVALVVAPLVNDFDVDGDVLSVASFTQPANGVVVDNGDATLTYTPDADWFGTDSFTYTVSDGAATATGTVWVVVAAVNDAPVAADDGVGTDEDTAVSVDVVANDF
ncbi:MAG: tandem-95 repeat protein, partial [Acidimicrobiia bacterium]